MHLAFRLLIPFAAGYFVSFLLRNVNAIIAPDLSAALGLSAADLGVLTAAYFLTFASIQLPLGILLDHYGARRVEAFLLLIAALGCIGFALGTNLFELVGARALIGLGVSACLMASFKVLAVWYPPERLPSLNAAVMVAGGLGALAATTPLARGVDWLGWRHMFFVLAALTTLVAIVVFTTPEKPNTRSTESFKRQLQALADILKSSVFWTYAPMTASGLGGFVALQGLWAVPWLMDVSGETRDGAAFHMLLTTVAMVCGWLATATLVDPLRRLGVSPGQFMTICNLIGLLLMGCLWLGVGDTRLIWFLRGVFYAVGNIAFADLTARFAPTLAGRVNTALNFCTFMGAFGVQIGYGILLNSLTQSGWTLVQSHQVAFGILTVLQGAGLFWYLLKVRTLKR
jgi:MFS family permease